MTNSVMEFNRPSGRPVLSVCMSVKNRSRIIHEDRELTLFPQCVRSLAAAADEFSSSGIVELVVVDYESDDWPLVEWFTDALGTLPARVISKSGRYSRGAGFNLAAAAASSDQIFLCNADMLIPSRLLSHGIEVLQQGKACFPLNRSFSEDGLLGDPAPHDFGNIFVERALLEKIGGHPEFESWGGDDNVIFYRVAELVEIRREHIPGFHHLWHPERCRHENYSRPPMGDFEESPFRINHHTSRSHTTGSVMNATTEPSDSALPMLTCLCPTYKRPKLLANLIFCFEHFDYPRDRCQLIVLDDAGQYPDQPAGENWKVVSHSDRYPTLGDKRNALAEMAPKETDAFVVMDDDEAYLPWTLRAHAWALQRSELCCPDRVLLEDSDATLVMEQVERTMHSAWAYSPDLFRRSGRYPSINTGEDLALWDVMTMGGARPFSATEVWPPWMILRWDRTDSYHMSMLNEGDYESISQSAENEQIVQGLKPVPLKDWVAAAIDFFEFGDPDWGWRDYQQAWLSRRNQVERKRIRDRARIAALQRRIEGNTIDARIKLEREDS